MSDAAPPPTSRPAGDADDAWLDALFGRIVTALADGHDVDALLSLPPERAHLAGEAADLLATARRIVTRSAPETPSVPGFDVSRLLGAGGMGKVYLATDRRLGRRVALKLLPARMASGRARARFEREARAVARLDHPLIVPIHGMGENGGHLWFSMQYVEGRTLAQIAAAARALGAPPESLSGEDFARWAGLPSGTALPAHWRRDWTTACVRAVADAADALAHAHALGVVHRDVKPSNVMVRPDGFAVVFDFGLADVEDETTLTLTRGFLGTPHYASPEQAAGDASSLDARSDVWSLAATLYEMLTLAPPFAGPTTHEVLRRIQAWDPDPASRCNPAVSSDLDAVLRRAMQKERNDRYAAAADFAADLRAVLEGRPVSAPREGLLARGLRVVKRNRALTELLVEQRTRNAELRDLLRKAEEARREAEREREAAETARKEADAARVIAERERDRSARTAGLFKSVIQSVDPAKGSKDVRLADLLTGLCARARTEFAEDHELRADLLLAIARGLDHLSRSAEAIEIARDAAAAAVAGGGRDARLAIEADTLTADLTMNDPQDALRILLDALGRAERSHGGDRNLRARILLGISESYGGLNRFDQTEIWARRLLGVVDPADPAGRDLRRQALTLLGRSAMQSSERMQEAIETFRLLRDECEREYGPEHVHTIGALRDFATAVVWSGDPARGRPLLEECLARTLRAWGDRHIYAAACRIQLSDALRRLGLLAESLAHQHAAASILEEQGVRGTMTWARLMSARADVQRRLGELAAARTDGEEALRIYETSDHPVARSDVAKAKLLLEQITRDEAAAAGSRAPP